MKKTLSLILLVCSMLTVVTLSVDAKRVSSGYCWVHLVDETYGLYYNGSAVQDNNGPILQESDDEPEHMCNEQ